MGEFRHREKIRTNLYIAKWPRHKTELKSPNTNTRLSVRDRLSLLLRASNR